MRASKGPRFFEARPCDISVNESYYNYTTPAKVLFFFLISNTAHLSLTISLPTFNNKTPKHRLFRHVPVKNFIITEYFSHEQSFKINDFFSADVPSIMFECPFSIFARINN